MTYQGKTKLKELDDYEERRAEEIKTKRGCVFTAFLELERLLNVSELARQYFHRSQSYVAKRINGCIREDAEQAFTKEEYETLSVAFRDIARRLITFADELDAAVDD